MPITIAEKFGSPKISGGNTPSAEITYVVTGSDDEYAVSVAVAATAGAAYMGYPRVGAPSLEAISAGIWLATVRFAFETDGGGANNPSTSDVATSFETGGGTEHITNSITTVSKYGPPSVTKPDFKGAIAVTSDGVQGVDIVVPKYDFSETHYFAQDTVTSAFRKNIADLTGKVNTATFKGFAAGEVLFVGASGELRQKYGEAPQLWEIKYQFLRMPNATGLSVGSITGIDKKGHELLWVMYKEAPDTAAKVMVRTPAFVFIEQVYKTGDFSALGIG